MKNNQLNIAMISEHGDPLSPLGGQQAGGQNVYVYELSRALSQLGIKVDVFTRWENRKAAQTVRFAKRAKVIRLKAGSRHFISKDDFGPCMPEFVEKFLEYSRKTKTNYNLLHTHYYYSGWAGLQLKYILKLPLVHTYHSLGLIKKLALKNQDSSPVERIKIETQIMKKADRIISTSPQEKLDMIKYYKVKGDNIIVIPPGVNLRRFTPLKTMEARKKLGLPKDKKIVVFAGKMEKRKGGATVVEATKILKKRWPEIYKNLTVYLFSGDPRKKYVKNEKESEARHTIKNTIIRLGLSDTVKLMPGIEQEELHYYFGAANVVVMPSYYEPFGMVAIEAMASGTPVVASNVGGLKWIIEDGITGFHAEPKDYKRFAKQIAKILGDEQLEDRLSKNAIIHARQNYSWTLVSKNILKVYKALVCKRREKSKDNL